MPLAQTLDGEEWYQMYDPKFPQPLVIYKPIDPTVLSDWFTRDFKIETIDALLPWALDNHLPSQEKCLGKDWFKYFREVENWVKVVKDLYRNNRTFFLSQVPYVMEAAKMLAELALGVYLRDPNLFHTQELDKRMWIYGVQEIVGMLRQSGNEHIKQENFYRKFVLPVFLKKMILSYSGFLDAVYNIHPTLKDRQIDHVISFPHAFTAAENKLLDLFYRVIINIGDMHRYSIHFGGTESAQDAYTTYERARILRVNNGRAYYQMGVLTMMPKKEMITAMYCFARAQFAKEPTEGAKSQLLEIHSRCLRELKLKRHEYWYALSKYQETDVKRDRRYPREKWIMCYPFPVEMDKPCPSEVPPPSKKEHIASLSIDELNHRFSLTFVNTLGKFYTRIGMDEFEEVAEESLVYFEGILTRKNEPGNFFNFSKMIHVVGLTTSIIENSISNFNQNSVTEKTAKDQYRYDLKLIVLYTLELYSIAVEHLSTLVCIKDWDSPHIEYLSAAVLMWSHWLMDNIKLWNIPHIRPRFSIRRIEKSRNLNRIDTTDDVWTVFAKLITRIETVLQRHQRNNYAFPYVSNTITPDHDPAFSHIPMKHEIYLTMGFPPYDGFEVSDLNFTVKGNHKSRTYLILRLWQIHLFGSKTMTEELGYLKRSDGVPGNGEYTCITKLLVPKDVRNSCGLHEGNYMFHVVNLERLNAPPPKVQRPPGYSARTIDRRKLESKGPKTEELPITDINKLWCALDSLGFRSDMVIIARRVVIDTNCFIGKLACVEKLIRIFTYPLLIPLTVVLELKGLAKGGIRASKKGYFPDTTTPEAREQMKRGYEVSYDAQDALELIEKHIRCFMVVTTRGTMFRVASIYDKIPDDSYNPTKRNDNKILEACIHLEHNDKKTRKLDTPMRLYRKTILLTDDRGLHVKGAVNQIPTKEIDSFVIWVEKYKKPTTTLPEHPSSRGRSAPQKSCSSLIQVTRA